MSANTNIEWCDATLNHWAGCTKVSPACDKCYAERMAGRLWGTQWGPGQPRTQFAGADAALKALDRKAKRLGQPLRVFHNSLSDFFDNEVPVQWRISALRSMLETPNLIHLVLTKRIGNAAEMLEKAFRAIHTQREGWADNVPPNIWIGATIVNQEEADRDIQKLLAVPAAKRFLSMEPLLGPVDIRKWLEPWTCADCGFHGSENDCGPGGCEKCGEHEAFRAEDLCKSCGADDQSAKPSCPQCGSHRSFELDNGFKFDSECKLIDWVIVGGESGPGARPMHPDWARSLRDQCQAAGVPFLFKQWGEWLPGQNEVYPDGRGRKVAHHQDGRCGSTATKVNARNYVSWDVSGTLHHGSLWDLDPIPALRAWAEHVGKKSAGRLLDGITHDGVPA